MKKNTNQDRSGNTDDQTTPPLSCRADPFMNASSQTALPKKKKRKKISILSILRTATQVLFFIWLPSLYISAFAGLGELISAIISGSFSWTETWPSLLALAAAVPVTILAGRFFCGWMCAFGALTDWIYGIFSHKTGGLIKIPPKADRILKYLKYVILAVLLVLGAVGTISVSALSPWDVFGMLFTVGSVPQIGMVLSVAAVGGILLLLILIGSAFVERFFCRYLCPMAAFFALSSHTRAAVIDKPREGCGKCRICTKNCAMGIQLYEMDTVRSGECIGCMKCVESCPRKNVRVKTAGKNTSSLAAAVVSIVLITGLYLTFSFYSDRAAAQAAAVTVPASTSETASSAGTSSTSGVQSGMDTTTAAAIQSMAETVVQSTTAATTAAGLYKDGTYTGTGTGFRGTTKLTITISGGAITDVQVVSYQDDAKYFDRAFQTISSDVVAAQSAQVDVVSHATYSSNGIIQAVSDALSQAKN
jgi:polyferredoxin/uncharacterized protein with FMN-binding domain